MAANTPTPNATLKARSLSASDLNKMKKEEIIQTLQEFIKESADAQKQTSMLADMNRKLDVMMNKITEIENVKSELASIKTDVRKMQATIDEQSKIIEKQQDFMDLLDSRERACNLMFFGIPENTQLLNKESDGEKVGAIVASCGMALDPSQLISVRRLGSPNANNDKPRPVKVAFAQRSYPKMIMEKKSGLQGITALKKVSIRKDTHPLVRKEWSRLNTALKAAKERPENQGKTVEVKNGILFVDGIQIDKYTRPTGAFGFRA